ncbi:MAG: hypothetical protein EXS16_21485 [Gemmataceae bacterium]|nr:hypothetical protein [Gemmataceae bacterium]
MVAQGFKYETDVTTDGTVTLKLPLAPGTRVEVFVQVPKVGEFSDIVQASASSTAFWDNLWDDKDWNRAVSR